MPSRFLQVRICEERKTRAGPMSSGAIPNQFETRIAPRSSSPGSSTCFTCDPGKYTNDAQTECLVCPAGKVSGVASSSCSVCEEGKYASGEANSECLACGAGKYANADKTDCMNCPAGKISGVASSECTVCETGKYAEGEGNVECRFCDDWDVIKGSGTYSNGTKSSEGCICPAGEFHNDATYSCEKVIKGVKTNVAGMNVTTLDLKPGYWRTKASSRVVTKCRSPEHCLGGSDINKQCKIGHQGPLCGVCSPGYASIGSGSILKCVTCSGGDANQTIASYSALLALLLAACVTLSRFASKKSEERNELRRTGSSRRTLDRIDSAAEKIEDFQPYAKIFTSYLQIVAGLGFALDLAFPPLLTSIFEFFGSIVNLDFLNLMPLGCLSTYDYHRSLVVTTASPVLLSAMMMIWYRALIGARKQKAANALFGWFLFLSFLVLPSVSTKIFYNFACNDFDGDYGSYLKVDLSIDCNSAEHKLFSMYAILAILVYPFGIPAMYMTLLYRKRDLVNPGADKNISTEAALEEREENEMKFANLLSIGFLYSSYDPSYYYFGEFGCLGRILKGRVRKLTQHGHSNLPELVETSRKLLLTGALVFFGPGESCNVYFCSFAFDGISNTINFSFVTGTSTQIVIAMVICVAMIKVLNISKPYHKEHHNIFHEIMQWQIFFVLLAAMMIKFEESKTAGESGGISKSSGFDLLLVCMQGVGPVLMAIIVMISIKVKGKKALEKRRQKRQKKETELTEVNTGRRGSGFVAENPMFQPKAKSKSFFASEADEAHEIARMSTTPLRRAPGKAPPQENRSVLRPNDQGLLAKSTQGPPKGRAEQNPPQLPAPPPTAPAVRTSIIPPPPSAPRVSIIPPPPPLPSQASIPPESHPTSVPTKKPKWTRHWDDSNGCHYYSHEDGRVEWD